MAVVVEKDTLEVVISDDYRVARIIMKDDWQWTPQRIKKAVVVARTVDIDRLRNLNGALVYFAGYPECFESILSALNNGFYPVGNPFKGSTVDTSLLGSRTAP